MPPITSPQQYEIQNVVHRKCGTQKMWYTENMVHNGMLCEFDDKTKRMLL